MKETFERLLQENIKAFVESFNQEPSEDDLEAIRHITHFQVALKGLFIIQNDTIKFIDYYQNVK